MKLQPFLLLRLLVGVSLLVQGAPLPAAARAEPDPPEPAAPTAFSCDAVTEIPKIECEALVALYNSTNGPGWKNKSGWLQTNAPEDWYGVACDAGHVVGLFLRSNQLTGTIPSQLGDLTNLKYLALPANQLTGTIPPQLGSLSNLVALELYSNALGGSIPADLGNLPRLELLLLYENQLSGSLPAQFGNLSSLINLQVWDNQLTGEIPIELGNLTQLLILDLGANRLNGSIPTELSRLKNLRSLFLEGNRLQGGVPPWLGDLVNLQSLNLSGNQLTGVIPPALGKLTNLQVYLALSDNQLSGTIPPALGGLSNLQFLHLSNNQLTGIIPPELRNLRSLKQLNLAGNRLTGAIPPELGDLSNLQFLELWNNQLTGAIPSQLGNLANLDTLSLFSNRLSGSIPPQLGNLANLHTLSLSSNRLSGSIPPELGNLASLQDLGLDYNPLTGALPQVLTNLRLRTFWFDNTNLCEPGDATFQAWLANIHNLHRTGVLCGSPSPFISHIEVTQATQRATQDESDSVPLIAGKPTFVRVYLDCGQGCIEMPVTGVLRGYGPSGELPGSPVSSVNLSVIARHEDWRKQRSDLAKTLNFTLEPEWLTGAVTLTVEATGATSTQPIVFHQAQSLRIIYVPIRYQGREPDSSRIQAGQYWARRVFPVAQVLYIPGTTFTWDRCLEKSLLCLLGNLNTLSLLNELTTRYRLVNAYVFGWLPDGAFGGGIADAQFAGGVGKAAFGDDNPNSGPRVFAHEMAHLLGRGGINTADCPSGDVLRDWPYVDAKIREYGLDAYNFGWLLSSSSSVKNPTNTYDYMSYCGSLATGDVWTSPWTYEHIYSEKLKVEAIAPTTQLLSAPQPYFIASGLIYTDHTATLEPIWVLTSTVAPENPPAGTGYCLEAQNALGVALVSRCFDLKFMNDETGEAIEADNFNLVLSYPDNVARIVLKEGTTELAVRPVSTHTPTVNVLSPNGGETWAASGTYTITWTASDLDGDPLTYSVLYSSDGTNWVPVGTAITATQLAVDTAELAGGNAARVRVLATDGVNTSSDESDGAFAVGRKGPSAFILAPAGDVRFMPGAPLWLQGYGYDLEDGTLEGAALRWRSDRDGDLGTGSQALVTLSPGRHTITLTAGDADGNTATASISVFAGERVYLPLVLR